MNTLRCADKNNKRVEISTCADKNNKRVEISTCADRGVIVVTSVVCLCVIHDLGDRIVITLKTNINTE